MDAFEIAGAVFSFFDPLELLAPRPHLLLAADERYPGAPKMLAREPRIDGGRRLALVATAEALIILGDDDASSAPWDRVLSISRVDRTVTVTMASDDGTDERDFRFERLEVSGFLDWANTPADRFVVALDRIRRDVR